MIASLSCHRPCGASACAGRNHERWWPSKAGAFGASVRVWESTPSPTIERSRLLRLGPERQPPVRRPSPDSNVCICGPNRNDKAGCAPVVHRSEQSLKRVYRKRASRVLGRLQAFGRSWRRPAFQSRPQVDIREGTSLQRHRAFSIDRAATISSTAAATGRIVSIFRTGTAM